MAQTVSFALLGAFYSLADLCADDRVAVLRAGG